MTPEQLPCSTCGATDWKVHHCADCRIKAVAEANSVERYKLEIANERLRRDRGVLAEKLLKACSLAREFLPADELYDSDLDRIEEWTELAKRFA